MNHFKTKTLILVLAFILINTFSQAQSFIPGGSFNNPPASLDPGVAKLLVRPQGNRNLIGHLQSGTFGSFANGSQWSALGQPQAAPGRPLGNLYGRRFQWDSNYFALGLRRASVTRKDAFLQWGGNNSNNLFRLEYAVNSRTSRITALFTQFGRFQLGSQNLSWINDRVSNTNPGFAPSDAAIFIPVHTDPETSDLRLYITDNSGDRFSIWGDSCGGGDCGNLNAASEAFAVRGDGVVTSARGMFVRESEDPGMAKNKKSISNAVELINSLETVSYETTAKSNGDSPELTSKTGLDVTSLEKAIPAAVQTDAYGDKFVNYSNVVPVLVAAIKEQNNNNAASLQKQIAEQKAEIESLKEMIALLTNTISSTSSEITSTLSSKLYFNTPNPFKDTTNIQYYLENTVINGSIVIFDINGREVLEFNNLTTGKIAALNIDKNGLTPGVYTYTLLADGKVIGNSKMVISE